MPSNMGNKVKKHGCMRTIARFMFSHIGLCLMVMLYCVAGGFIFEHLEKNNEEQVCYESRSEYEPMESKTINSTLKIFYDYGGAITNEQSRELMIIQLQSVLETFRNNTLAIGYNGRWCQLYGQPNGPVYEWSWAGAVLFSVTVVTTIGYGHIAPKTVWGRLVCIAYAILGVPLMLLCLSVLGDALANIFRFIYSKVCCCGYCMKDNKKVKKKEKCVDILKHQELSQWDTNEALQTETKLKYAPISHDENVDSKKLINTTQEINKFSLGNKAKIMPLDLNNLKVSSITEDTDSDDDDDDFDARNVTVPLTITMIVIGGYIFGGAILFGLWEGWDWLQSAYFCFITLSTIGFGDVVPGRDFDNPQVQAQLMLGSIYILFGMAILSMCFSLMQEEILAKARWIGQKLGIIDKEADD